MHLIPSGTCLDEDSEEAGMRNRGKIMWLVGGLICLLAAGNTFAFWSQRVEHTNHLVADEIKAEVVENYKSSKPEQTVVKEVSFHNSGSTDAFVRIAYVETWEKEDTNKEKLILSNQADETDIATKNWTDSFNSQWQDGGDGWLYYNSILKAGESTDNILESVTFPDYTEDKYKDYENADYSLYFKVEMLQASTGDATLNKEKVNADASVTVFGKTAVVDADNGTVTWQ